MSLQRCSLSWQAFTTCASHAMSTEKQEVMGLLLGRWHEGGSGRDGGAGSCPTVTVDHAMILTRTDKREDRVEVGYKQLAEAADIAERMSAQLGQDTRVVGWYHSHPHITVLPSHVDVRTQGQYQSMDKRFIGLIFSVFSEDKQSKVGTIEVTAFQARDASEMMDVDGGTGGESPQADGGRSNGGGSWERTEVALSLHGPGSGSSTTPLSDALERVVRLQDTLFGEERATYLAALRQNDALAGQVEEDGPLDAEDGAVAQGTGRRGQGVDLLSKLFCSAVYSKSLAALSGDSAVPLAQTLRSQLKILQNRAAALELRQGQLRALLTPAELDEAVSLARTRLREPCSAGIGAFQAKHEGELDIPRADALRFAREGAPLRRQRIIQSTTTVITVRIFREGRWRGRSIVVVDLGGKRKTLLGLRAAPAKAGSSSSSSRHGKAGGGSSDGKQQRRGLLLETKEHGEEVLLCDEQESFRMWLGVAAAVFPS
ncbi:unnamed protein product, partial [Scytosiphon promiscuus]